MQLSVFRLDCRRRRDLVTFQIGLAVDEAFGAVEETLSAESAGTARL